RLDAAAPAEQVMDHLLVELVVAQIVLAGRELEVLGPDEREQQAPFRTMRAIARDHLTKVGGRLVAHASAMAAARASGRHVRLRRPLIGSTRGGAAGFIDHAAWRTVERALPGAATDRIAHARAPARHQPGRRSRA